MSLRKQERKSWKILHLPKEEGRQSIAKVGEDHSPAVPFVQGVTLREWQMYLSQVRINHAMKLELQQIKERLNDMANNMLRLEAALAQSVQMLSPIQQMPPNVPQPHPAVQTEATTSQVAGNAVNTTPALVVNMPGEVPETVRKEQQEKETRLDSKMESLEEKVRGLQGIDAYGNTSFANLCFFPNLEPPPKYKTPDFVKYNGTGGPMTHLKIYCGEMSLWGQNEKFLMQQFQKNRPSTVLVRPPGRPENPILV